MEELSISALLEEAGAGLLEGGVVCNPGTHDVNQGRGVKPNTGTSRPGGPYQKTTPPTKPGQSVLPAGTTVEPEEGGEHKPQPEQTVLPGHEGKDTKVIKGTKEMQAMKMLGGDMRWLEMSREQDQMKILVEERKLDDIYHASRLRWRQQRPQPRW